MTSVAFVGIMIVGAYLLLRSWYPKLTVSKFIGYAVAIVVVGLLVFTIAKAVGTGVTRPRMHTNPLRMPRPVIEHVEIIELDADDLDPEIQNALIAAINRRNGRRRLTVEEMIAKYTQPQEDQDGECGVCYEELEKVEDLLACPECHKAAHKNCLQGWLDSGQHVCIYCRHDLTV